MATNGLHEITQTTWVKAYLQLLFSEKIGLCTIDTTTTA